MALPHVRERTLSTASLTDIDGTRRRSSSRAIKRPKFDDELVESSLGSQSSAPFNKIRTRNPSLSTASDCSVSLPPTPAIPTEIRRRLPTKSSKKTRKGRRSQSVMKDLGRWKPTDDLALIIGVQQTCDLVAVYKGMKFSCKFTMGEVQERWYALLYDPTVSRVAQQAMKNLHPEQIAAVQAKALYSKAEEELLGTIHSTTTPPPTLQTFETLLLENPSVFYPARTGKVLFTQWQLMKQYNLLPDQTVPPLPKTGEVTEFTDAEEQINDSELYDKSEEHLEHELNICSRGIKKEIKLVEEQVSRWQVVVDSVMGISPQDFDNQTFAVLRGRLVKYLMRSKEITIGRKAPGYNVDVDLSLEGPAWKVSRKQGIVSLRSSGEFFIANEGKRPIHVDGSPVLAGAKTKLNHNAVIEISSLRFIFLINQDLINGIRQQDLSKSSSSQT